VPQLDSQSSNLDGEGGGIENIEEQGLLLLARGAPTDMAENDAAALDRRSAPAVRVGGRDEPAVAVHVDGVAIEAKAQLELAVAQRVPERPFDILGLDPTAPQILDEVDHDPTSLIARSAEAPVDHGLDVVTQRAKGHGHHERGARRDPR